MGIDVTMFFTFYGLGLLKKKLNLKVSPLGNAAMEMPDARDALGMPNLVAAIPGVDAAATAMMKNLIKKKGVASIEELRTAAVEVRRQDDCLPDDHGSVRIQAGRHDRGAGPGRRCHLYRERRPSATSICSSREKKAHGRPACGRKRTELPAADSARQKGAQGRGDGGTLQVLATDPGAVKDFEAFCRATGNDLMESKVDGKIYSFVIKRLS